MPVIDSTEYNLVLDHVLIDPLFVQDTTGIATVVITGTPPATRCFNIQTNQHGIFLLVNKTVIEYTGSVYLPPNVLATLTLTRSAAGVWRLGCSQCYDTQWSPVLSWIKTLAEGLAVTAGNPPPLAARKLAAGGVALYQSLVQFADPLPLAVANEAGRQVLLNILPALNTSALYDSFPKLPSAQRQNVVAYVQSVVAKVMTLASSTASNPVYAGGAPVCTGKYLWSGSNPVLPNWGLAGYLAYSGPTTPLPNPTPLMDADAAQLQTITANRTVPQEHIARYFAGAPPSHLTGIVVSLLAPLNKSELDNAQVLALTGLALADAGVYAWSNKFLYWGSRPDQFIAGYKALIPTPNFPGFISGHSTFSAAVARVVQLVTPQTGKIIKHIADVSGISRLYGGIHFQADNGLYSDTTGGPVTGGLGAGNLIGQTIVDGLTAQIKHHANFIAVN